MRRPPTYPHTHTRHMFLGNVNECVTKKAMKTLNTIRPCATKMSYTTLCVSVCARGCVCLHNQGQASACGCRELHKSHSESIRKHKCEKANSSRCPGTRFNVGLTTDTPHPHHPTTCAHTLTHTSRLKARHKHSESLGVDVMQLIILHESNPKMKCD